MDYCKGNPSGKRGVITGMYRVIIVDDEYYIRKRICRCIDWEAHGFCVEAEIESGEKAAFYIQQNQVDLAVVDISMPDISGLELIERIRKENSGLKIIILTGYDYFEYAKKAVNLGVSHFMLKPVDKQEMSETVIKIREELDAAVREKKAIQELKTDNERLESASLSRMLLENGSPEDEVICQGMLENYGIVNSYSYMLIYEDGDDNANAGCGMAGGTIAGQFQEEIKGQICLNITDKYKRIFRVVKEEDACRVKEKLEKKLVICAGPFTGTRDNIRKAYASIRKELFYDSMVGAKGGTFVVCCEDEEIHGKERRMLQVCMEKLEKCLEPGSRGGILDALEEFFDALEKELVSLDMLDVLIKRMLYSAYCMTEKYLPDFMYGEMAEKISAVQSAFLENGSISRCRQDMLILFEDLAGKAGASQYVSADQIVKKVKGIVKKQYSSGELGVQRIAESLCLNANYVGITFKRAAGISISQYINQVRMENAAYLIVHTLIPIQEIAETVGYSDQFYFSKKFKQLYGMSPSSYRYSNSNV